MAAVGQVEVASNVDWKQSVTSVVTSSENESSIKMNLHANFDDPKASDFFRFRSPSLRPVRPPARSDRAR